MEVYENTFINFLKCAVLNLITNESFFGSFHFLNDLLNNLGVKMSLGGILLVIFFIFLLKCVKLLCTIYSRGGQSYGCQIC